MRAREPFKFLDAYTREDGEIFFGREAESEELHSRVLRSKLLLVYGPSGTGKTSLIQCGLGNQFDDADWFPVFIRYGENIFDSIDRELERLAVTAIKPALSLAEKFHSVYLDYFKPIHIIFDQFEELFIFGAADERERLAEEIVSLLDVSFELKIIFVIREEYLAELTALESHLPDLFTNRFRVERMGRANAISAIESPCKVCGIGIEDGLAERILEQLGTGKTGAVELTYLQVLLDKLYVRSKVRSKEERHSADSVPHYKREERHSADSVPHYERCLTTSDLEALGTIGDILGEFLDEQLVAMSEEEASLGEAVLKTLITPDGTKKTMGVHEIVSSLTGMGQAAEPEQLAAVLNHFVSVRILSEKEDSGRYELRHDSLAQKIFERMTALEKDLLEVIQMVENRYKEYQARGTFLDHTALDYVAPYQSHLRFKPQLSEFIGASKRQITKARRKKLTFLFASLIAIFMVVSGLGILSYLSYLESEKQRKIAISLQQEAEKQRQIVEEQRQIAEEQRKIAEQQTEIAQQNLQQSKLNEIDALNQTSKALFLSHDELGALLVGVKAGVNTIQTSVPPLLKLQTNFNLRELVDSIHEKNRLEGSEQSVTSVTFSPDGTLLASGSGDGAITLRNVADGRELATLEGHHGFVNSVIFSPDGTLLASGGFDRGIRLWKIADGSQLTRLQGHSAPVQSVTFSPDGTLLASGSTDRTIKLWRVVDGRELATLQGHADLVQSVNFSPDGALLASGSNDKTIKLWNVADGRELATLTGHSRIVQSVTFSPDGTLLASGSRDNTIKLWKVADGRELTTLHGHTDSVQYVAFNPDGTLLASGSHDKTLILWKVNDGSIRKTFQGHSGGITSVAFSPDGTLLASGSIDKTIKLWQFADDQKIPTLHGHSEGVLGVAFSPDGTLLASGSHDTTIKLWNVRDGSQLTTLSGHSDTVFSVAFSPDGKLLASGSWDNTVKLWKIADRSELATLPGHSAVVFSVAFSPDGTLLASGGRDTTIKLWQVADGRELITLEGHSSSVHGLAFSPDGTLLASGNLGETIKLWQVADGTEIATLRGHSDLVESVAFSPDGTLLASSSWDGTIKLWQVAEGSELITLEEHSGIVPGVDFSPDGTLLASGSGDRTVKLWNVADDKELATLRGHSDGVGFVDFSPDGTLLASGSDDKTIKLWPLDLEYFLARGCEWLQGYLKTNPNVSETDRTVCDEVLANDTD